MVLKSSSAEKKRKTDICSDLPPRLLEEPYHSGKIVTSNGTFVFQYEVQHGSKIPKSPGEKLRGFNTESNMYITTRLTAMLIFCSSGTNCQPSILP
jgi:hypothetical protein